jgi:hypothetical protein
MQLARDAASKQFEDSELGRRMSERARSSPKAQTPLEPWEKEVVAAIEGGKVDR